MRAGVMIVAAALAVAGCAKAPSVATSGVTDAMIANPPAGEWLTYGRTPDEQRFSPLDAIGAGNVGQLGLAWSADLDTARGQEATPLMHDGVLYVSTAWSMVKAYDATSGKLIWAYDPKVPRETLAHACCDAVNRGVALYGNKVYVGTLDGRLVALDQKTGAVAWSKTVVPNQQDYTITGAPRVAKGLVLIGSGGAEYKARGSLAAFDAETGREVWRFHTVPGNPADGFGSEGNNAKAMEAAAKTWKGEWWKLGGGGTVWDSITYDPATNLVLFGTGNAEPWNAGAVGREGEALYTASVVAVDATTGEYRWHFKETPEDRWDFDSDAQITLTDMVVNGQKRHVALHAPKNGYFYVLDAKTGQFLSAGSIVPQNWTTGIDPKTGQAKVSPEALYDKSGKPFVGMPGAMGAHSWQPMSFSPKAGLVYIPVNVAPQAYFADRAWKPSAQGYQVGLDMAATSMPANPAIRAAAMKMMTGMLLAWNPATQKPAWSVPHISPWNGGTLATAGNLVFQGDATGQFSAYSADKGSKLWSFGTQTGVIAAPMTYAVKGEQYVAVLAGWGGVYDLAAGIAAHKGGITRNISRLLVFKLGAKGQLPPPPPVNQMRLDPPAFKGTAQQVAAGAATYARYCSVCHGDAAVAGGLNPDLRHSPMIGTPEALRAVAIDGALQHNGMVSFKAALKPEEVEAVRQYLIKRANEDKALGEK